MGFLNLPELERMSKASAAGPSLKGSAFRIEFEIRLLRLHQDKRTTSIPHNHRGKTISGIQLNEEGLVLPVDGTTAV